MRSFTVENQTLVHTFPDLQTSFECIVGGKKVEGDCDGGGKGSPGCPCPDIQLDDPRVPLMFQQFWPLVDPRRVAEVILRVAADSSITGETVVVDKEEWNCPSLFGPPLKSGQCCG